MADHETKTGDRSAPTQNLGSAVQGPGRGPTAALPRAQADRGSTGFDGYYNSCLGPVSPVNRQPITS